MTARWNVVLSPTLTGMVGSCGATPPASNITTRFGACVRWASMAAAQGTPVPTATVLPSSNSRAAQQIMSSMGLWSMCVSFQQIFQVSRSVDHSVNLNSIVDRPVKNDMVGKAFNKVPAQVWVTANTRFPDCSKVWKIAEQCQGFFNRVQEAVCCHHIILRYEI